MNVYDIDEPGMVMPKLSVVAEDMAAAERMFKKKFPHANINRITLHSEYVDTQVIDIPVKKDIHS